MKLKTLAKQLDLTGERGYFDYCIDSYINGNFSQCKELFKSMVRRDRKEFIMYVSDQEELKGVRNFYFALL